MTGSGKAGVLSVRERSEVRGEVGQKEGPEMEELVAFW